MGFFAGLSRGIMVPRVQHPSMPTRHPEGLPTGASCHAPIPTALHELGTKFSFYQICLPVPPHRWLSPHSLLTKASIHPGLLVRFVVTPGHLLLLFYPSLRSEPPWQRWSPGLPGHSQQWQLLLGPTDPLLGQRGGSLVSSEATALWWAL